MISDEQIRQAACQAEKNLLASLPEPEDCNALFTSGFQRKMRKLVRRTEHPFIYRMRETAACLLYLAESVCWHLLQRQEPLLPGG